MMWGCSRFPIRSLLAAVHRICTRPVPTIRFQKARTRSITVQSTTRKLRNILFLLIFCISESAHLLRTLRTSRRQRRFTPFYPCPCCSELATSSHTLSCADAAEFHIVDNCLFRKSTVEALTYCGRRCRSACRKPNSPRLTSSERSKAYLKAVVESRASISGLMDAYPSQ